MLRFVQAEERLVKACGGRLASVGLVAWMMAAIFGSQGEAAGAEELAAQRQGFTATYREQLELLAKWCDDEGLTSQAEKTRAWLPLHHARLRYVFVPPTRLSALEPPDDLPPKEAEWLR